MIKLLLVLGALLYAIGRSTTEAVTFEWKNNKDVDISIGEYHWWGLIETLGIVLFASYCFADGYLYTNGFLSLFARQMANTVCFFLIYYPIYSTVFNAKRGQTQYYYSHYKLLEWEIPYPNKWIVAVLALVLLVIL